MCLTGLHVWVRKNWPEPQPELCQICNIKKACHLANISTRYDPETYTRDFKNWQWLCAKCHVYKDGTVNNLKYYNNGGRK